MARTADKEIYLSENRYEDTKEYFKFVGAHAFKHIAPGNTLIDHGCAAGEFLYYAAKQCPTAKIVGSDVVPELLSKAAIHVPGAKFITGSILDSSLHRPESWDAQFVLGVHSIFEDQHLILSNLSRWAKPGGKIWIFGMFNEHEADVLMKYKTPASSGDWETGWNLFSHKTMLEIADTQPFEGGRFHRFNINLDIPAKGDPARTWTVKDENQQRFLRNGLGQIVELYLFELTKKS